MTVQNGSGETGKPTGVTQIGGMMSSLFAYGVKFSPDEGTGAAPGQSGGGSSGGAPASGNPEGQGTATQDGPQDSAGQQGSLLGTGQDQQAGGQQPQEPASELLKQISDESLRNDPSLKDFKSLDDLAKSYVHAQKLVGKEKIPVPTDENDTEAWNAVLSRLGRPEAPNGYELPDVAEDSKFKPDEKLTENFKQKAHELGFTPKQAKELWSWYVGEVAEPSIEQAQQQAQEARQSAEQELRKEFGNAFEERIGDARKAVKEFGGDGALEALEQSGLANDPTVIKLLANAGKTLREDTVGGSAKPAGRDPQQAQQEINVLKSDQSFLKTYMDPRAPGHQAAVERMQALYKDAYPDNQG